VLKVLLCAALAASALVAVPATAGSPSARPAAREALVQRAAAALKRGDAVAALRDYEAAAAQEHAADIEVGVVRSLMLAGHYRRALAFAAHTAQAHPDAPAGASVYAQLLEAGGHGALAARVRPPGAPMAAVAPAVATGVLIDAGRHALLPLRAVGNGSAIELRDGHGSALAAQLVRRDEALGLALLRLDAPPSEAPQPAWAPRDAFPGSVAHAVAAAPVRADAPPWPRLHSGFIGVQALGIELIGDARGGAVFDAAGRVVGIALARDDGTDRLVGTSALRTWLVELLGEPSGEAASVPASPLPLDAIYEGALRLTVQLRASPTPAVP
jgi:hypothetical protein